MEWSEIFSVIGLIAGLCAVFSLGWAFGRLDKNLRSISEAIRRLEEEIREMRRTEMK